MGETQIVAPENPEIDGDSPSAGLEPAGELVQYRFRKRMGLLARGLLLFFAALAAIPVAILMGLGFISLPEDVAVGVGAGLVLCVLLIFWSSYRRMVSQARSIATEQSGLPLTTMLHMLLENVWLDNATRIRHFVRFLSQTGGRNITGRAFHESRHADVSPLSVTFEPIPLDESAPSFIDLQRVGERDSADDVRAPADGAFARADGAAARRMRRSVTLMGGWLFVGVFGFNFITSALMAYDLGRVTMPLIMWALFLTMGITGIGGRGAWHSQQQWLLVPGGLVARNSSWRAGGWRVHLFARTRSVLFVHQFRGGVWVADVADGETHQHASMTEREPNLLLRAWLSPLSPPAVERLSDLE